MERVLASRRQPFVSRWGMNSGWSKSRRATADHMGFTTMRQCKSVALSRPGTMLRTCGVHARGARPGYAHP